MFRWAKGMFGSGLPRASHGMLPLAHSTQMCPCMFDVFSAWEGPQVVTDFEYPGDPMVTGPVGFPVLKIVRQLRHYPGDYLDGRLVFESENNSLGVSFPTTIVAGAMLHDGVDITLPTAYGTLLESPQDLTDPDATEDRPFRPGTVTVYWHDGAAQSAVDDTMGGFTGLAGTIDYCTRVLTLDFTGTVPLAASDITIDYTVMGNAQVATKNTGTYSGGYCTQNSLVATQIDYTAWSGVLTGTTLSVVAGNIDVAALANGTYYLQVSAAGAVAASTTITVGQEILCWFVVAGGAITGGPYEGRLLLTIVDDPSSEALDYYYYAMFVYDLVSLMWHKCVISHDYTFAYDTQYMIQWLWDHVPRHWQVDDDQTPQLLLEEETESSSGELINIHDTDGRLRGQLYRFLKYFGLELERMRAYFKVFEFLHIDVDNAPPPILNLMAETFAFDLPRSWDIMRKRVHVKHITGAYQWVGRIESVLMAVYRITGIVPTYVYMHERLLYTNMNGRFTLNDSDTEPLGDEDDPRFYVLGPDRPDHYHERGLSLYFVDPMGLLTSVFVRDMIRSVKAGSGPVYSTTNPDIESRLIDILFETGFIVPSSLTISWTSLTVAKSMTDDGAGGFLAGGDGDPTNSSVNYTTGEIILATTGDTPDTSSSITATFTSHSRGVFVLMRESVRKEAGATVHLAFYVNDNLVGVSE